MGLIFIFLPLFIASTVAEDNSPFSVNDDTIADDTLDISSFIESKGIEIPNDVIQFPGQELVRDDRGKNTTEGPTVIEENETTTEILLSTGEETGRDRGRNRTDDGVPVIEDSEITTEFTSSEDDGKIVNIDDEDYDVGDHAVLDVLDAFEDDSDINSSTNQSTLPTPTTNTKLETTTANSTDNSTISK